MWNEVMIDMISLDISDRMKFIINPILDYYSILEKIKAKVVYNSFFRRNFRVIQRLYSYPIYLPEIGYLLSLDISSKRLSKKFLDETKDYESFYSENSIMHSRIYNYNKESNRGVSWGQYAKLKLSEDIYQLYITNLVNDLLSTPSIVQRFGLFSPNRWFHIESQDGFFFKGTVNYNVGVMYLKAEDFFTLRKFKVWINSELPVYEIKTSFITFSENGHVNCIPNIRVHFLEDPSDKETFSNLSEIKGDYFISYLVSFNNYQSNYKSQNIPKKLNLNFIENLTGLVYTPYEIFPLLFPKLIKYINNTSSLVFNISLRKQIFNSIIHRLMKFGPQQDSTLIESFIKIFEKQNKLLRIYEDEHNNNFYIKFVNPAVIPFIMKKLWSNKKNEVISLLINDNILNKLEELDMLLRNNKNDYKLQPIAGIQRFLKIRSAMLLQYSKIYERYQINKNHFKKSLQTRKISKTKTDTTY